MALKAVSNADPRQSASVQIALQNPLPVVTKINPAPVTTGLAKVISLTGTGFVPTSKVGLDDTEIVATFVSSTKIDVTTDVKFPVGGYSRLAVINPDPGAARSSDFPLEINPSGTFMTYAAAARFLEQASWGPSPDSIVRLMEIGREAWIDEQFREPMSIYPDPPDQDQSLSAMQKLFFRNALQGKDQLRQRVAFGLSQIFVVSGVDLPRYWQTVGFQRLMMNNALGNYRTLMQEVTLNPAMGEYLDMVNNDKPNPVKNLVPNENYGRELLQLFSLGLFQLNPDGTRKTDASGPLTTYTEDHVKQMSLAFTGWTYPAQPGFSSQWKNPSYYYGRMTPFQEHHDVSTKTVLPGVILMPNQSAEQDLNDGLNAIFNHSNLAPFVALRMIQKLTASSPSPQYIGRVAAAFSSPRGDMKAMVRAILLDPEAANGSHLREPVLFSTSLARTRSYGDRGTQPRLQHGANGSKTVLLAQRVQLLFADVPASRRRTECAGVPDPQPHYRARPDQLRSSFGRQQLDQHCQDSPGSLRGIGPEPGDSHQGRQQSALARRSAARHGSQHSAGDHGGHGQEYTGA